MTDSSLTVGELREAAARVLNAVDLRDVALHSVSASRSAPGAVGPFTVTQDIRVRGDKSEDSTAVNSWAKYQVEARPSDMEVGGVPTWSVTVELVATYAINSEQPEDFGADDLTAFSTVIGLMTIHPYARETIQTVTSRMGFPPFTLALLEPISSGPDDEVVHLSADGETVQE